MPIVVQLSNMIIADQHHCCDLFGLQILFERFIEDVVVAAVSAGKKIDKTFSIFRISVNARVALGEQNRHREAMARENIITLVKNLSPAFFDCVDHDPH